MGLKIQHLLLALVIVGSSSAFTFEDVKDYCIANTKGLKTLCAGSPARICVNGQGGFSSDSCKLIYSVTKTSDKQYFVILMGKVKDGKISMTMSTNPFLHTDDKKVLGRVDCYVEEKKPRVDMEYEDDSMLTLAKDSQKPALKDGWITCPFVVNIVFGTFSTQFKVLEDDMEVIELGSSVSNWASLVVSSKPDSSFGVGPVAGSGLLVGIAALYAYASFNF